MGRVKHSAKPLKEIQVQQGTILSILSKFVSIVSLWISNFWRTRVGIRFETEAITWRGKETRMGGGKGVIQCPLPGGRLQVASEVNFVCPRFCGNRTPPQCL